MIPMWIRRLIAVLALSAAAMAQTKDSAPRYLGSYTVASAPAAASWSGYVIVITDSATAGSCTSGGGSAISLCRSSGSAWVTLGGAGTTYTAGASGAITITGSTIDVDTAYVPGKTTTNAFTGVNDFSGATRTAPMKVGTSDPATCTVGDFLFRSDTSTTKACTATNTWTAVGGGGGGAVVRTTYASLPACGAGNTNYQYVLTDSIYSANCNGSSYAYWAGSKYIPTLPWSNGTAYGSGASVTATTGSVLYDGGSGAGADVIRLYLKAIPTAPYTIIMDVDVQLASTATNACGLWVTAGTTQASDAAIGLHLTNSKIGMVKYTNGFTYGSTYFDYAATSPRGKLSMRLVDDNTNRTWSISVDRINWVQVAQHTRTDFLTATHYGYGCNMAGVGGTATMVIEGLYAQ